MYVLLCKKSAHFPALSGPIQCTVHVRCVPTLYMHMYINFVLMHTHNLHSDKIEMPDLGEHCLKYSICITTLYGYVAVDRTVLVIIKVPF